MSLGNVFRVEIEIRSPDREEVRSLSAMVDTDAVFSQAPAELLRELGMTPESENRFRTADNRVVTLPTGQASSRLEAKAVMTLVGF